MAGQPRGGLSSSTQLLLLGMIAPIAVFALWIYEGEFTTDFAILRHAARLFLDGDWSAIYKSTSSYNFPYPPHALLLFTPFACVPYWQGLIAWNLASAAFFAWAASRYVRPGFALLTPGALMCLYYAQTGLVVGGLWLMAFRGQWVAVSLLSFKPHLGILSVLTLRNRRRFLLAAVALTVLAAPFISLWPDFLEHSLIHGSELTARLGWSFAGVSPGIAYGLLGWAPFAVAAALLLRRNFNVFTAATAALLISPYGFSYDMPMACLGIWYVIQRHWDNLGPMDRLGLALGFLAPSLARTGIWWVPPILLWCLWVQVKLPPPAILKVVTA